MVFGMSLRRRWCTSTAVVGYQKREWPIAWTLLRLALG